MSQWLIIKDCHKLFNIFLPAINSLYVQAIFKLKATVSQSTRTEKPWLFYGINLRMKKHASNKWYINKQRRSPKEREAFNIWILIICEITFCHARRHALMKTNINRIAYLWKQVLQNFQPLRISCSVCLRSTF